MYKYSTEIMADNYVQMLKNFNEQNNKKLYNEMKCYTNIYKN